MALWLAATAASAQNAPAPNNEDKVKAAAPADGVSNGAPAQNTASSDETGYGVIDSNDPLLKPPPLPPGKPTLVGGIVAKIDRIRNQVTVRPFGGGAMIVYFDERSHIYRDGVEATQMGIHRGDRVYVDTISDGARVFAKNIRVETKAHAAETRGQVVAFDTGTGEMDLRDELSWQPITIWLTPQTQVKRGERVASRADLVPGSLVGVTFAPDATNRGIARQVTVFATPGSEFLFSGKIMYLDLSRGRLVLNNRTDSKSYEVEFDPQTKARSQLGIGVDVTVNAVFDGSRYTARNITVNTAALQE